MPKIAVVKQSRMASPKCVGNQSGSTPCWAYEQVYRIRQTRLVSQRIDGLGKKVMGSLPASTQMLRQNLPTAPRVGGQAADFLAG